MAASEVSWRVALWVWGSIAQLSMPTLSKLPRWSLTSRAHLCLDPAETATAVLPDPRSTEGRFVPISARGEQKQK